MNAAKTPASLAGKTGRRGHGLLISLGIAAFVAVSAATMTAGPADAAGSLLSISSAELAQFGQRLKLTREQRPKVNAITQNLVRESAAIFRKYGITGETCVPMMQLAALNNEVNSAYVRARGQLAAILSAEQMRQYASIYQQRRLATKAKIICNG